MLCPMAKLESRLPENAPGNLFVDDTCIDCGICRWLAPGVFAASQRSMSFVRKQPMGDEQKRRAAMALVACPTSSIGGAPAADVTAASRAFPELVEDEVYFCGYASPDSYGASSWLIRRPGGNVLVDSPRAAKPLL